MLYEGNTVKDMKIAYIGGGSRGWAWTLMRDLTMAEDLSGKVALYDIDLAAAKDNEIIGNNINKEHWSYEATETIGEALTGADFVIISILPGTFDEMDSDVHAPEEYGIYQSVGDTTGAGGFIRALRTVPMFREIARAIKEYCPEAWVINYTNPMAICIEALYREFPEIKAFGCCHEVFGTQKLLSTALDDICGIKDVPKEDVCVEVVGVNHFTWFTKAQYRNIDLFPVYEKFVDKYYETGHDVDAEENWMHVDTTGKRVRFDLFRRFGYIAAAGDRHLAEFMPPEEYLKDHDTAHEWKFTLTPISWRKNRLEKLLAKSKAYLNGEEKIEIKPTGEEGVKLMRALMGLSPLVTNVNIPNRGQISNLPIGTVVETNATFRSDELCPVFVGDIPESIYELIRKNAEENSEAVDAAFREEKEFAFEMFARNHTLHSLNDAQKRDLFEKMWKNTEKYLTMYR